MRFITSLIAALPLLLAPVPMVLPSAAIAQSGSVVCKSVNNSYKECFAGSMRDPQLVRQLSRTQCVQEQNWGFNQQTNYIWVGSGCQAEFADGAPGGAAGCHGNGCLVDNPDRNQSVLPPSASLTEGGIERCSAAAVAKGYSMGRNPRVVSIIDQYPDDDGYHVEGKLAVGSSTMSFLCVWNGRTATVMLGSGM